LQLPVAISIHRSDCQTKNSNDDNNKKIMKVNVKFGIMMGNDAARLKK
jgi:hypothetical protein